jgi:hypothetical protein
MVLILRQAQLLIVALLVAVLGAHLLRRLNKLVRLASKFFWNCLCCICRCIARKRLLFCMKDENFLCF